MDDEKSYEEFCVNIGKPNSPETEDWLSFGEEGFLDLDESEFTHTRLS